MIFITVGTTNKGFDRLIKTCDEIAGALGIDFFAQTGCTAYQPKNMPFSSWLSQDQILSYYNAADGFIIHGGFGTLSEILPFHKPIIAVPRLFEYGEAVNDQNDICAKLDAMGYVKSVTDLKQLENLISNFTSLNLKKYNLISDIPDILSKKISLFKSER